MTKSATPKPVTRPVKFRREVSYTSLYVFSLAISPTPATLAAPSIGTAVEYALNRMRNVYSVIDWFELSKDKYRAILGIPEWLPCGARFATSLTLSSQADSLLSDFILAIAPDFTALRKRVPYRPFAVALLFRAVIADEMGKLPYKVVQPENAAALKDAPAAFDPEIFDALYPNGTNAPVDADGYDATELF